MTWIKTTEGVVAEVSLDQARHLIGRGDAVEIDAPEQPEAAPADSKRRKPKEVASESASTDNT